jgi:hypothetical protein
MINAVKILCYILVFLMGGYYTIVLINKSILFVLFLLAIAGIWLLLDLILYFWHKHNHETALKHPVLAYLISRQDKK